MKILPSLLCIPFFMHLASAATYTVGVGKDETTGNKGVGFDPSAILPQAGDIIVFEFRSGAHSVVESSFDQPCTPLAGGFNTGVITVADNIEVDAEGLPTVSLTVNNTEPIWLFDQASGECTDGAVLSVNPTAMQTAAQFKENSLTATESPPDEVTSSLSPSESTTETASTSASSATTSTSTDAAAKNAIQSSSTIAVIFAVFLGLL